MKLAIRTVRIRDLNGNTTYTAFYDGKRKRQQKILSHTDTENHEDIARQMASKLGYTKGLEGARHDDKTMFWLGGDVWNQ